MPQHKLKPIPFSRFYDSVSSSHRALLLEEDRVTSLVESNLSFFTKTDTVFENEDISITRIIEPVIRGEGTDFLARELFVATLNKDVKHKFIVAFSPIRFEGIGPLPDKQIRLALISSIKENWNLTLNK